jgi:hypothetical protein
MRPLIVVALRLVIAVTLIGLARSDQRLRAAAQFLANRAGAGPR